MKNKNRILAFLFALFLAAMPTVASAAVGISLDGTNQGGTEHINFIRGGTTAAQSGRKFNVPIAQDGLVVAGAANGDATSLPTTTLAIPVTSAYVNMKITNDPLFDAKTLADGVDGQIITLHVYSTDGGSITVTPATAYGWSVASFNAIDDQLTLLFLDGSGWVILHATSVTVTP